MIFVTNGNEFKLKIPKKVKKVLLNYRQDKQHKNEACGILIGEHANDGKSINISNITIPKKKDIRKRYRFFMKSRKHQEILEKDFKMSNYESVYLGTWHSHPEGIPNPSKCDINDWFKQFDANKHIFSRMIFGIVGTTDLNFWLITEGKLKKIDEGSIIYE